MPPRLIQSETFKRSLEKLQANEQTLVKASVMDLFSDISEHGKPRAGLRYHEIDRKVRDPGIHSISPGMGLRVIIHQGGDDYVLLYVDHHNPAYDWAERRRRRAESRGRVELVANASGTATLSFVDAPALEGIASMARVEALASQLRAAGVLTPAEKQLAAHLRRNYPVAGLASITRLGRAAGVSSPTVVRLVQKLSFRGYPEFQAALREELAAQLGSDVPFALTGGTALGTGRGEKIVPVLATGTYHWLFALTHEGLSTPAVYAECDRLREGHRVPEPTPSDGLLASVRSGDVHGVAVAMHNDLEPAALSLMPRLRALMEFGLEMGALNAMVSGSGPTVAFLMASRKDAVALRNVLAAGDLADDYVLAASTPHGAQVVSAS